jgi:hypothetical protein
MATKVLVLEFGGAAGVLRQRVGRTVQERVVPGFVEMVQLAKKVTLRQILGPHT